MYWCLTRGNMEGVTQPSLSELAASGQKLRMFVGREDRPGHCGFEVTQELASQVSPKSYVISFFAF